MHPSIPGGRFLQRINSRLQSLLRHALPRRFTFQLGLFMAVMLVLSISALTFLHHLRTNPRRAEPVDQAQ